MVVVVGNVVLVDVVDVDVEVEDVVDADVVEVVVGAAVVVVVATTPLLWKATICIAQALLFWVAVAAYEPAVDTERSISMFQRNVDRVVHPEPVDVTALEDTPTPTNRSEALVVVIDPLDIALELPDAEAVPSNGVVVEMPLYSDT